MRNMAISTIDKELLKYFTQLDEPQKKSLLALMKTFLKSETTGRVSIETYNRELDEAMEEIKNGEVYSHDEVVKMSRGW